MTTRERWAPLFSLMERELVVATGCTEPAAVAYTAALARAQARGEVVDLVIRASGNIIKNAMSVTIPGTTLAGMEYAAALGALFGDPGKKLQVLAGLGPDAQGAATDFVAAGNVLVEGCRTSKLLYVEVVVRTDRSWGRAVVEDRHDGVTLLENPEGVSFSAASGAASTAATETADIADPEVSLEDILDFASTVDLEDLGIIRQTVDLARSISAEGLEFGQGLGVGRMIEDQIRGGLLSDDVMNHAMARTAAGTDARMAGSLRPVMANSGSGNQGISATLPVVAVWEKLGLPEERLIRAATISNLVTIASKGEFGKLSALCGVVLAATGAACGVTWLLGGTPERIELAIQNVIGNVSGMMCDGAKSGCALKVSTCTAAAVQAALLAVRGVAIPPVEGILGDGAEGSIRNLARIGNAVSPVLDPLVVDIMVNKRGKKRGVPTA